MSFGKDISIEEDMSEAVEGGAALAWRLLATLEGGSLLLATSALLAYTVRNKIAQRNRPHREIRSVLVTNTTNLLGRELKRLLEAHGCLVSGATSGAASGAAETVDALVVVGAEPKQEGLDGVADLVSEDVYNNLKILSSLSVRVRQGGCVAWACTGATHGVADDAFSGSTSAFDTVLHASLEHVAQLSNCEPIWVGRCDTAERTARLVVAALMPCATTRTSRFSVRYAAHKVGLYLCRWLKIVS